MEEGECPKDDFGQFLCMTPSPSLNYMFVGTSRGYLVRYDISKFPLLIDYVQPSGAPISLEFPVFSDSQALIGTYDEELVYADLSELEIIDFSEMIPPASGPINALRESDNGMLYFMTSNDFGTIDLETRKTTILLTMEQDFPSLSDEYTFKIFHFYKRQIYFSIQKSSTGDEGMLFSYDGTVRQIVDSQGLFIIAEQFQVNNQWLVTSNNGAGTMTIYLHPTLEPVHEIFIEKKGGFPHPSLTLKGNLLAYTASTTKIVLVDIKLHSLDTLKIILSDSNYGPLVIDAEMRRLFYTISNRKVTHSWSKIPFSTHGCLTYVSF